eukprot:g31491.t1
MLLPCELFAPRHASQLFQQKLRAERKAETQALRARPQTMHSFQRSSSEADLVFPETPSVLASPAFSTLRGAGRLANLAQAPTFGKPGPLETVDV